MLLRGSTPGSRHRSKSGADYPKIRPFWPPPRRGRCRTQPPSSWPSTKRHVALRSAHVPPRGDAPRLPGIRPGGREVHHLARVPEASRSALRNDDPQRSRRRRWWHRPHLTRPGPAENLSAIRQHTRREAICCVADGAASRPSARDAVIRPPGVRLQTHARQGLGSRQECRERLSRRQFPRRDRSADRQSGSERLSAGCRALHSRR